MSEGKQLGSGETQFSGKRVFKKTKAFSRGKLNKAGDVGDRAHRATEKQARRGGVCDGVTATEKAESVKKGNLFWPGARAVLHGSLHHVGGGESGSSRGLHFYGIRWSSSR